jgi:two-component system NtrC family sensor kinase
MAHSKRGRIRIVTKLILSFLLIIVTLSVVFTVVGAYLIDNRVTSEAQEKVRTDFNAAQEIYLNKVSHIFDVVRLQSERFYLKEAILSGNIRDQANELVRVKQNEDLDILTLTDTSGKVLLRVNNLEVFGDSQIQNEIIQAALEKKEPIAGTTIFSYKELEKESPLLALKAHISLIDTPLSRLRPEREATSGMILMAAAPVVDYDNHLIAVLYGGILLNRNYEIVDKIKETVFQEVKYKGRDIGTATIFLDDYRISTNVENDDGSRAIGSRIAEEVYVQVVEKGEPWIGRAFVVNNWYITTYAPIKNIKDQIIGILYVGILEQKYIDIRNQIIFTFLCIMLIGALASMLFAYIISQTIAVPIHEMLTASEQITKGNLEAQVEISSKDELGDLARTFNTMANALKQRDQQLRDFATQRIMQSERLAMIGQLAANVAHELNNPLTGIVTYSHLLLERATCDEASQSSIQKIANQANRCRDIIRGLLDFSRQRKPQKKQTDINLLAQECISFVEKQALFHNVQIVKELQAGMPMLVVDPSQIQQVFMNMIINAAEAMNGDGRLTVTTHLDATGNFVEIEFSDTGIGISEENIEKIFDPFFTTKEVGHGTGLGLAISYGIVKEHNGSVTVHSEVGRGTTFIISLPLFAEEENNKQGLNNG